MENPINPNELITLLDTIEPIRRRRISFLYLLGLSFITVIMILLPLLYIALIGVVIYGMYYHALFSLSWIQPIRPTQLLIVLYLGPLFAGFSLIVFMLKPLFAKPLNHGEPLPLSPNQEARLFDFVNRMAEIVRAPKPTEIRVDLQINASASLIGGISRFFRRKLCLTIGLPLVSGMNLTQFSGILAHELGHFSQGAGMRLCYVIESINYWFARMVYEPDNWDDYLKKSMESSGWMLALMLLMARLFIIATRYILYCYMIVGRIFSCFFMRQMEYDADRMESIFTGSSSFRKTLKRLWLLILAELKTKSDLDRLHTEENRLVDDWSELIAWHASRNTMEELKSFVQFNSQHSSGFFATHPSEKKRIAHAEKLQMPGLFQADIPATTLFSDFSSLSKECTLHFYESIFEQRIYPKSLISIREFEQKQGKSNETEQSKQHFFGNLYCPLRPISISPMGQTTTENLIQDVQAMRQTMQEHATAYETALKKYIELDNRREILTTALVLSKNKVKFKPKNFNLKNKNYPLIYQEYEETKEQIHALENLLQPFESAVSNRFNALGQLLDSPFFRDSNAELNQIHQNWPPLLSAIEKFEPIIKTLREHRFIAHEVYILLCVYNEVSRDKKEVYSEISQKIRTLYSSMESILFDLGSVPYLFDHAEGTVSVRKYACPDLPPVKDYVACVEASQTMTGRVFEYYERMISELANLAKVVENNIPLFQKTLPQEKMEIGHETQDR